MTEKKKTFLDAIKDAQTIKTKIPQDKAKQIQQSKTPKSQINNNRPTKRSSGRGG